MSDDLFSFAEAEARARRTDPQTSHDAAASVNITRQARLVLDLLDYAGNPVLDEQLVALAAQLKIKASPSGIRSRRATLVEGGYVEAVGTAPMSTGRLGTLHQLTAAGRALLFDLRTAAA